MSGSNGLTVVGPDARRAKWAEWYIVLVAGRLFVGRMHETPKGKHLAPFYDFNSGVAPTPSGLVEMHRAFPPLAFSLKRLDLPRDGYVLWSFIDLDDSELAGMEAQIAVAEELCAKMRAARSNITIAPGGVDLSKLGKPPSH